APPAKGLIAAIGDEKAGEVAAAGMFAQLGYGGLWIFLRQDQRALEALVSARPLIDLPLVERRALGGCELDIALGARRIGQGDLQAADADLVGIEHLLLHE